MPTRPQPTFAAAVAATALFLAACGAAGDDTADPGSAAATASVTAAPSTPVTAPSATASPNATASPSFTASPTVAVPAPGAYLTKAEYQGSMAEREGTRVVYFFHASWCPTCRAAERAIERDGIPAGLTVVKVDFDDETALRREHGVTVQHTFVQVDPSGRQLAKWTGSEDGAAILAKTV